MSIASRINEMTEHLRNNWNSINKLGLKTKKLPDEYRQVEYIESSGTQYIDTGHYPSSNNDELEIQANYVGGNTVACLFGTFENNYYYYQLNKTATANQFRLITYRGDVFYTFENYASKHTYLLEGNKLYIDNTEVVTGSGTVDFESQTMYLFARNNSGTPNQFGSWRIYSCKIKTSDILVRDFVPCYRISDNVAGLYDTVNDIFYTNQGTGAFTYGEVQEGIPNKNIKSIAPVLDRFYNQSSDKTDLAKNGVVGRTTQNHTIPVEYTRVDYIESSGTQYIDTGVKANQDTITDVTLEINKFTEDYNVYFGSCRQFSSQAYELMSVYRPNYGIDPSIANTYNNNYVFTDIISTNTKYNIRKEKNVAYLDGNVIAEQEYEEFETPVNMYIFATNSNGNVDYKSSIKLYKMTISDGTNMIRNFIPCYRNSDNVVGLYDIVNNVFYTNQGTGAFTYGNIIVEPSPDYPLEINNLNGDVEYKVRGKNKLPFPYTETTHTNNGITYTINDDGTVLVNGTATAQSNTKLYGNYQESNNKEPIGKYLYGGTNEVRMRALNNTGNNYHVLATDTGNGAEIDTSVYKKYYIEISVLNGVTVNNVLIKPMVLDSLDDLKYEPYISESFPLSLKSRNLFDKDNINVISAYISGSKIISSTTSDKLIYIPCKPNTTYSLQKMLQETANYNRFRIGTTTDIPALRMTVEDYFNAGDGSTLTNKTIVTGANANYLVFYCYREDTLTSFEDMISSIQIEEVYNLFVGYDNMKAGFLPMTGEYPTTNSSYPNAKYQLIELKQGESVITSGSTSASGRIRCIDKSTNKVIDTINNQENNYYTSTSNYSNFASGTITAKKDIILGVMFIYATFNDNFIISKISPSPYEPYYDINLCNISDYKDRIYSQNGEFYLEKKTGKIVFDGSENWTINTSYTYNVFYRTLDNYARISNTQTTYCEYYKGIENAGGIANFGNNYNNSIGVRTANDNIKDIYISNNSITSASDFKSWLTTHNTIVYYVLATPTTTEITSENYPTLYSQLLAIQEFLTKYKINNEFLLNYSSLEIFLNDEIQNPPSESGIDWSTIGYDGTPEAIKAGYDYAKSIYDSWDSTTTSMSSKYYDNREIMIMPLVDTSNVTNMDSCFYSACSFSIMPSLNTSKVTNMKQTFRDCRALQIVPPLNTGKVTTMQNMFTNCYSLKTVPLFDTSSINSSTSFTGMFNNCIKLTDASLDNILQMCVNATGYPGTKTLYVMGFVNKGVYPVSRIEALPHYQDFIDAGWTIGY